MTEERFTQELPVELGDEEWRGKAVEMAVALSEADEARTKRRELMGRMKQEVDELLAKAQRLTREVLTRVELRPVACRRVYDYGRGKVAELRDDNGRVVSVRDLTDNERHLFELEEQSRLEPEVSEAIAQFEEQMRRDLGGVESWDYERATEYLASVGGPHPTPSEWADLDAEGRQARLEELRAQCRASIAARLGEAEPAGDGASVAQFEILRTPYEEGRDACLAGTPESANPYDLEEGAGEESEDWAQGWSDAWDDLPGEGRVVGGAG